jgi:hypothetical protein
MIGLRKVDGIGGLYLDLRDEQCSINWGRSDLARNARVSVLEYFLALYRLSGTIEAGAFK